MFSIDAMWKSLSLIIDYLLEVALRELSCHAMDDDECNVKESFPDQLCSVRSSIVEA